MHTSFKELLSSENMSIIVSLPENRVDLARAAVRAGADALKFHINVTHRASGNHFKGIEHYVDVFKEIREEFSGPMGIVLGGTIEKVVHSDAQKLKEIGFSYYSLYPTHIGSKTLLQTDLQHTVAINEEFTLEMVKALNSFPIDAIELSIVKKDDYGRALNLKDLVIYKAIRDCTTLPLIVPSQKRLILEDLKVLKEIGINAVMMGVATTGYTPTSIYESISLFTKNRK
ncbi:hypothetical protein A8F94_21505 [Bacillus sp. FJAT-27225]|uniref:hypothetical protein n=1 Tax=Bacillus sp. FJAT-27225 TaxID=1743144 RepID=UPI00080C2B85|nr:hypothetical protein [Bacillus sp. FJAT-27225]OCA81460.1 hypothetical protein A8F94_21505 [Bacillus sp. FJAT-27225]